MDDLDKPLTQIDRLILHLDNDLSPPCLESLRDEIVALEARIAKADALAEALSIFAKKANLYDGAPPPKYWGDTSFKLFYHWDEKVQFEVELGTLRKARAVIAAYREGSDT